MTYPLPSPFGKPAMGTNPSIGNAPSGDRWERLGFRILRCMGGRRNLQRMVRKKLATRAVLLSAGVRGRPVGTVRYGKHAHVHYPMRHTCPVCKHPLDMHRLVGIGSQSEPACRCTRLGQYAGLLAPASAAPRSSLLRLLDFAYRFGRTG